MKDFKQLKENTYLYPQNQCGDWNEEKEDIPTDCRHYCYYSQKLDGDGHQRAQKILNLQVQHALI